MKRQTKLRLSATSKFIKICLILIGLCLVPQTGIAGGDDVLDSVEAVNTYWYGRFEAVFQVVHAPGFQLASGCMAFSVTGWYSPFAKNKPNDAGWKEHRRALEKLDEAKRSSKPLRFGAMLDGLKPRGKDQPCSFASRGLFIYESNKNEAAVLSYYN